MVYLFVYALDDKKRTTDKAVVSIMKRELQPFL